MWSKELECEGREKRLLDCPTSDSAKDTCSSGRTTLMCRERPESPTVILYSSLEPIDVRLVDGGSRCAGRLEVEHQREFRPVSYWDSWGLKDAAVACRQLNCGSAVSTAKNDSFANPLPTWRFFSECDGSESALMDCGAVKLWPSSSTVEVVCSDLLLQPNVTVYSFMAGPSEGQQQGLQLFRGQSFNISCSTQPQYPGGQYTLMLNQTLTQTQQAVNHSAHFLFPIAEDTHQGNYSCLYHNYVFNHNFSSESQTLSLTLTGSTEIK
ncbi:CD5 antigen-like [Centroberyx gerrardi]